MGLLYLYFRKMGNKPYSPNHIPVRKRREYILFACLVSVVVSYSLYNDDFYFSTRRMRTGVHFHGFSAWLMSAAFVCMALNMLAVVFDHYDKRDNEIKYRQFARATLIFGLMFFIAAFAIAYIGHSATFERKY
jgi:hypothetical protein